MEISVSMRTPRTYLGNCVGRLHLRGFGQAIPGRLERYDPERNAWETMPSVRTGRYLLAAAILDGFIYVAGGKNHSWLSSVERCDVKNQSCRSWPDMHHQDSDQFALVTCKANCLTPALGNAVERYDPGLCAMCEYVAKLPKARWRLQWVCIIVGP